MLRQLRPTRRLVLGGLGALAARPAWALTSEPDIVIIGAGAAGIGAAITLQSLGRSVVIVEAEDRIGGRAYTDTMAFGVPFDIGCAWIHAADRNPFYPLAQEAGFRLQYHELEVDRLHYGRRRASRAEVEEEREVESAMVDAIGEAGAERDIPSSQAVEIDELVEEAAATYLGPMDMGVDLDELSTSDYGNSADLDPNYLAYEGFGTLVAKTGEGLPVKLGTPALAVRYGRGGVEVETGAGTLKARAAIVTVSPGVLASGALLFDPALPDWKEDAIANVPMGMLAKIPLLMRTGDRFGAKPFEDVLVERTGRQDIYFLAWPFETDLLVGFVGGDFGWELSAAGEAAAIDFAKEGLKLAFGSKAPERVEKGLFTRWANNPWTRGAYAAAMPGHYASRAALARSLDERVFFAGEALAGELIQTCGGAYLSGADVARAAHASLT